MIIQFHLGPWRKTLEALAFGAPLGQTAKALLLDQDLPRAKRPSKVVNVELSFDEYGKVLREAKARGVGRSTLLQYKIRTWHA